MKTLLTNLVVRHFVSGGALFSGLVLVSVAAAVSVFWRSGVARVAARLTAAVGVVVVAMSATPFPWWVYFGWAGTVIAWLGVQEIGGTVRTSMILRVLVLAVCALVGLAELPNQFCPSVVVEGPSLICVIGDSISSGIGEEAQTWPQLLEKLSGRKVLNVARAGATLRGAWSQAGRLPEGPALILIEVGGNDLLGRRELELFEKEMRRLFELAAGAGRSVVMFELPLPPLHNSYGRVQRSLAREFGVALVPKRVFARVLTTEGATLDGVHLSDLGHRQLAEHVAGMLEP